MPTEVKPLPLEPRKGSIGYTYSYELLDELAERAGVYQFDVSVILNRLIDLGYCVKEEK